MARAVQQQQQQQYVGENGKQENKECNEFMETLLWINEWVYWGMWKQNEDEVREVNIDKIEPDFDPRLTEQMPLPGETQKVAIMEAMVHLHGSHMKEGYRG